MIAIVSKPGLEKNLGERLVVTTGTDKLQASKKTFSTEV